MKKNIVNILLIIILGVFVYFILMNSFLFNYKKEMNNYMDEYYVNRQIESINELLNKYKNNEKVLSRLEDIIDDNIQNWVAKFNIDYDNNEDLDNGYDFIINLIDEFIKEVSVEVNKDYKIEKLYEYKKNYLLALDCYDKKDFSRAYEYLELVDTNDSYFKKVTKLKENIYLDYMNSIKNYLNENLEDNLDSYKNILKYLEDEKENSSIDISLDEDFKKLEDQYIKLVKEKYLELINNNRDNYEMSYDYVREAISFLTSINVDANEFIPLLSDLNGKLDINITELEVLDADNEWNQKVLAVSDNKDNVYKEAIVLKKSDNTKSSISYNLNGKYKSLEGTIGIFSLDSSNDKSTGYIKIYGDDKLLYTSKKLNQDSNCVEFNIDVHNINVLRITGYITYSNSSKILEDFLIIGNTSLESE